MANDAARVRKELEKRGYTVLPPTGRGKTYCRVFDGDVLVAKFPINPKYGKWEANLMGALRRYERTGDSNAARSDRKPRK